MDEVIYTFYPDENVAQLAFEKGDVDLVGWPIPAAQVIKMLENPKLTVRPTNELAWFYLAINIENSPEGSALKDKKFRQAVAYATDKDYIVGTLLRGYGAPLESPVSSFLKYWYNPDVGGKYPFDLAKAAAILDEAEYVDSDGDGIRNNPTTGENLEFELIAPFYDPIRQDSAKMIRDNLAQVGVKINVEMPEFDVLMQKVFLEHTFDLFISGWGTDEADPDYLYNIFGDGGYGFGDEAGINAPGPASSYSPRLEEILLEQKRTVDSEERRELIYEAQEILTDELPFPYPVRICRTRLQNQGAGDDRGIEKTLCCLSGEGKRNTIEIAIIRKIRIGNTWKRMART